MAMTYFQGERALEHAYDSSLHFSLYIQYHFGFPFGIGNEGLMREDMEGKIFMLYTGGAYLLI